MQTAIKEDNEKKDFFTPNQKFFEQLRYRADIDGLRAIAVLSVVVFHAFPGWLPGGFVGVDIFFVISGFLISSIIIKRLDNDSLSLSDFYSRRIRRIFPALIVVLSACFVIGWFELLTDEYKQLGKHITAGASFISNFVFWLEAGYFDSIAESKPLLHLWSLGIEEQFYIVWPLLLGVVWKKRCNFILFCIAIIAISFALNIYYVNNFNAATFYNPLTRFWELVVGALMAYINIRNSFAGTEPSLCNKGIIGKATQCVFSANSLNVLRDFQSVFGAVLIGIATLLINSTKPFPGWWVLLPTVGTVLIIAAGPHAWMNRTVLSNRLLVWVGLISFPLYLWHWPLLSFARIIEGGTPAREIRIVIVLVSIILAWLTYILIERPLRYGQQGKSKVVMLCILMLTVGYVGYNTYQNDGFPFRYPPILQSKWVDGYNDLDTVYRHHSCFLSPTEGSSTFSDSCVANGKKPMVFLWGDSHAAALYPGLNLMQQAIGFGLVQRTASACPPILGSQQIRRPFCKEINDSNFMLIKKLMPDIVLLHASWDIYDLSQLDFTISELKRIGVKRITIIGPVPQWQDSLYRSIFLYWKNEVARGNLPVRMSYRLVENIPTVDDKMKIIASQLEVEYVSAYKALCNKDGCLTRDGKDGVEITAFDQAHLTLTGSRILINHISDAIFRVEDYN